MDKSELGKLNLTLNDERENQKQENIRKKRLKFENIPITAVTQEFQNESSPKENQSFVKTNDGVTEILNPSKQNTIKMKAVRNKIESRYIKRIDLQHIEEVISNNHFHSVMPDFGFDNNIMEESQVGEGWKVFLDFCSNHYKYERLENYVSACQHFQSEREKVRKKRAKHKERAEKKNLEHKNSKCHHKTIKNDQMQNEIEDLMQKQKDGEHFLKKFLRKLNSRTVSISDKKSPQGSSNISYLNSKNNTDC